MPYSFRHQLSLTSNVSAFRIGVEQSELAGNVDSPESGMDALMQAIACGDDIIGWRKEVRKVLIFITDQDSHYAMDGNLAGIPLVHDGQCHMTLSRSGNFFEYSKELEMDYPSFGQIREKLNEKNMVIIFAVKPQMDRLYRDLSLFIQSTENVGHLTSSSKLEEIIAKQYEKIKSSIVLRKESPLDVDVKVNPINCKNSAANGMTCFNVTERDVIRFKVGITLKKSACSGAKQIERKLVRIGLAGFPSDQLRVGVTCAECQCENDDSKLRPSSFCSSRGVKVCGGCDCQNGFIGKSCECDLGAQSQGLNSFQDTSGHCKDKEGRICGDRGNCFCEQCLCHKEFLGPTCQCEKSKCPIGDRIPEICSGEGRGRCYCEKNLDNFQARCKCEPGYTGPSCSCPISDETCRDELTNTVCFGESRGTCKCGICNCKNDYSGKFCQNTIQRGICERLEPCVKAHQYKELNASASGTYGPYMSVDGPDCLGGGGITNE